ncbi:MAG: hypothetical protein ACXVBD_04875 [Pseudobdellovibrio sp.]
MKKITLIAIGMIFVACANQACKIEERTNVPMTGNEKTSSQKKDLSQRVFVYKLDGSLQCEQGKKIALDTMKKDLGDIEVFSSDNKHDGMMRIQVCGSPTGMSNVYEIDQKDLDKALKLGFKKWLNN